MKGAYEEAVRELYEITKNNSPADVSKCIAINSQSWFVAKHRLNSKFFKVAIELGVIKQIGNARSNTYEWLAPPLEEFPNVYKEIYFGCGKLNKGLTITKLHFEPNVPPELPNVDDIMQSAAEKAFSLKRIEKMLERICEELGVVIDAI